MLKGTIRFMIRAFDPETGSEKFRLPGEIPIEANSEEELRKLGEAIRRDMRLGNPPPEMTHLWTSIPFPCSFRNIRLPVTTH